MNTVDARQGRNDASEPVAATRNEDDAAFAALAERHRRELQVHCYRMLGSFDDAEDQVQETFLRAWNKRSSFEGRSTLRAWLYRIATNACLDFLERRNERALSAGTMASADSEFPLPPHIPWLQPFPDRLLESVTAPDAQPDAGVLRKENIELAFLVAIQFLPARQRAVLILCDVLDWSAKEAAELLDTTVAAVNGALQRARATLHEQQRPRQPEWAAGLNADQEERQLVQRYVDACERNDPGAVALLLRDDVRCSMPPQPETWAGRESVLKAWTEGGFGSATLGEFRCLLTRANRMPAVACYLRAPGESTYKPLTLDVLEIEDGKIADVTTFALELILERFALPASL